MVNMTTRALVTNQRVAEDLGITHSAVSRIRSNDREPSLNLMMRITALTGWGLNSQAMAIAAGNYGSMFESILADHYVS